MTGSALAERRIIAGRGYNGRHGWHVTHITLHIMCGYLTGTEETFKQVKAASHYGIGGDGRIWQWVDEDNGGWADALMSSDCSGISIEHQGGLAKIPCTDACVDASARLCADIARRYGWPRLWHDGKRGNVWLHREVGGHSDHADCPDLAPNGLPVDRVIALANQYLNNEEDDMPSAQEVADAVWSKVLGGGKQTVTVLTDIAAMVEDNRDNLAGKVWDHDTNGVRAADRLTGIDGAANAVNNTIPALQATIAAQGAAIEALSKVQGVDPDTVAKAVQQAVADKLAGLKITVE